MSGFENFQVNSFEQLCINVANEHLQYYFNEHIFLQEEQDYRTEGVSCEKVEFQNNEDLIELFMGVRKINVNSSDEEEKNNNLFFRHWEYLHYLMKNLDFRKRMMNLWYKNFIVIVKIIRDILNHEAMKRLLEFIITLEK
jgi:hypothetical protein